MIKPYWTIFQKYYKPKQTPMKKIIEFAKKWYPVIRDVVVAILAAIQGSKM